MLHNVNGDESMRLGIENWRTFEKGVEKEYLVTNGLGGFCSSTLIGANIRKYHGLLNAALSAPTKRLMLLTKLDESIAIGDKDFLLSSNELTNGIQEGFAHLTDFSQEPVPTFSFTIGDLRIVKTIAMEYGKNTVSVCYRARTGRQAAKMRFVPFVNFRDHHNTSKREGFKYDQNYDGKELHLIEQETNLHLRIASNCSYEGGERWIQLFYRNEAERGLEPIDFNFIPGSFTYDMKPYGEYCITFVATIEEDNDINPAAILNNEKLRRKQLAELSGLSHPMLRELVLAADQFITKRSSTDTKTIVAGYPWFTDWGRDTMIAFTGTTLATGRYRDAKEILLTFTKYIKDGLIPNMFPDQGYEPIYNTADATLWFFYAVYKYLQYTKDAETVRKDIYPHLKEIVEWHRKGTMFNIFMDQDGLVSAGNQTTQLTWMDVKVGEWVVTPRHGKAVELNALWYNALKIMEELSDKFGEDGSWYSDTADKVKQSFNGLFWNDEMGCLYDVIQGDKKVDAMRPNQIIAVSLPFEILDMEKSRMVVQKVWEKLYTPYGLRSLAKDDAEYKGIYIGDVLQRDGAYHRGTVWAWLIGPLVDAYVKVNGYSAASKSRAKEMLEAFYFHMQDACIGSVSEIFDGDEPFYPRGCMAQAWSVAEVLRAYVEIDGGADTNENI